ELEKCLAEAGRPTNIREEKSNSQLVRNIVPAPEEVRRELIFGAAVNRNQYRTLTLEPRRRHVEETGDFPIVEARPLDHARFGKIRQIDVAGLALRPSLDSAGRDVE